MKKTLAIVLLGLSPVLLAAEKNDDSPWSGEGDLAFSKSSGNSDNQTLLTKLMLTYTRDRWTHVGNIDAINASEDNNRSAEAYTLRGKSSFEFRERYYGFANGRYEDNRFSGYDYQASVTTGLGMHVIDNERTVWDIETGVGYRRSEEQDTDETFNEAIFRAASTYRHQLTETTRLENTLGVESGADNTFAEGVLSLRVSINSRLGLRVAYSVKHNTDVPEDSKNTDTLTSVGLTYSF